MNLRSKVAVLGAPLALVSASSMAAIDTAVSDAVTAATADITTVGGLILVAAATAFGIRWVKATFF